MGLKLLKICTYSNCVFFKVFKQTPSFQVHQMVTVLFWTLANQAQDQADAEMVQQAVATEVPSMVTILEVKVMVQRTRLVLPRHTAIQKMMMKTTSPMLRTTTKKNKVRYLLNYILYTLLDSGVERSNPSILVPNLKIYVYCSSGMMVIHTISFKKPKVLDRSVERLDDDYDPHSLT